ncbi:cation:proton antiporter [Anaerotignum sp. MB30-C6]|uniref:cation:proton antiporter n=1 Tax=Anaerotignum sp. MB30-C6 TaxID=3070814 RepID=UPI0027DB60AD|nr:cation:proton antiporter [Anaerotignum sp. MB30-C6]WMI80327.1 cation:proton antiporter [Anaerotignum sp. MB30-C6]
MESYDFLMVLALILLSTKMFGLATEKVHLPQVVGALIAGIILGPSGFGILRETEFLLKASEIGVIMLMFTAGLDTNLNELKKTGLMSFLIAIFGVLVPLVFCGGLYYFFFSESYTYTNLLNAVFIGVIFSATSVSITVETLSEMGKIKTRVGTTIISAAIIDDIIGIIMLSIISGLGKKGGGNPMEVVGKIFGFFVFVVAIGLIVHYLFKMLNEHHGKSKRAAVWALAYCFLMSYGAEEFFGVADITGAYFAGLILCNIAKTKTFVAEKIAIASYLVFSPVFFASIGIKTNITGLGKQALLFAAILFVIACATKIIGCGGGAKLCKMTNQQALGVGVGMMSRGEVALMLIQKGVMLKLVEESIFPALVLVIIATVLVTPVFLNLVMKNYSEHLS